MEQHPPFLFEASWEVCNKVGGIHTVLTSKLPHAQAHFPGNYMAVGPWLQNSPAEFDESETPKEYATIASALNKEGVVLHFGTWRIPEAPPTVLIDWSGLVAKRDAVKTKLWEECGLDTMGSDLYDFDMPLLWSVALGMLVEQFSALYPGRRIYAQGHEWLAGGLFLWLKTHGNKDIASIFTTHATVLGRALSSRNVNTAGSLAGIDPELESRRLGVVSKHQLERLSAQLSTVFTTVSQITAGEAAAFLGRPVDVVVDNGLDIASFPGFERLSSSHAEVREQLHDFVSAYFFPSHRFDLDKTRYCFTMGRYETHNKGYDLMLESLGDLNRSLVKEGSDSTMIAFFLVPSNPIGLRPQVVRQVAGYSRIASAMKQMTRSLERDAYARLWNDETVPTYTSGPLLNLMKETVGLISHDQNPPVSPFVLPAGENDDVVRIAREQGLLNRAEDRVKVVFFPLYIDGLDGIFNLSLYDLVSGFDLGVFASLYEPWGYTPMESLVMGVPAIISTNAGFGRALQRYPEASESTWLLDRSSEGEKAVRATLTEQLGQRLKEDDAQWFTRRAAASAMAARFDWAELYANYRQAYALADSKLTGTKSK